MAETTNNEASESNEPTVRFGLQTPFGIKEIDLAEIPDELRDSLAASLHTEGLPDALRDALAKALGVDLNKTQSDAQGPADAATGTESADGAETAAHSHGCNCAELHRERVWGILDAAFPNEPHLWHAMEALFTVSATNPHEITDVARRAALDEAKQHIERQIELVTPSLSPLEQMVEQFRKEMGL